MVEVLCVVIAAAAAVATATTTMATMATTSPFDAIVVATTTGDGSWRLSTAMATMAMTRTRTRTERLGPACNRRTGGTMSRSEQQQRQQQVQSCGRSACVSTRPSSAAVAPAFVRRHHLLRAVHSTRQSATEIATLQPLSGAQRFRLQQRRNPAKIAAGRRRPQSSSASGRRSTNTPRFASANRNRCHRSH